MTHGWDDSKTWVPLTIEMLLKYRGGCVIFLNYSSCVDDDNYILTLNRWPSVSAVVTKKLISMEKEGILPENIFMYGFSLGARIVIDAAINFGKQKIGLIDSKEKNYLEFLHQFCLILQFVNQPMQDLTVCT